MSFTTIFWLLERFKLAPLSPFKWPKESQERDILERSLRCKQSLTMMSKYEVT